jgi:hypothetical protein
MSCAKIPQVTPTTSELILPGYGADTMQGHQGTDFELDFV